MKHLLSRLLFAFIPVALAAHCDAGVVGGRAGAGRGAGFVWFCSPLSPVSPLKSVSVYHECNLQVL